MDMKDLKGHKPIRVLNIFGILFVITCAVITILNPISKSVNVLNITFLILQAGIGLSGIIISRKFTKKFFQGILYELTSGRLTQL